jgi:AcrR family transcriptional regulator
LRRDAQARRDALLDAATACFRDAGYQVPLEEIAERAGVGRGTLYRNFRDREALALAIFAREIDRAGTLVDPEAPVRETLAVLIRSGAAVSSLFARIAGEFVPNVEPRAKGEALGDRMKALLAPVAARAQARGELRAGVGTEELVTAIRMVSAVLLACRDDAEKEAQIDAALDLLFAGLSRR